MSLTFSAVAPHVCRLGAVAVGLPVGQRAAPPVLAGVLRAQAQQIQAHLLTVDQPGRPAAVAQLPDNPPERRQLSHGRQGDGRHADVPRQPAQEQVADDLHEVPLGPHLVRLGDPVQGERRAQVVPPDGQEVPAAVVDRLVGRDGGLGAVDAEVQPQPTARHRQQQEVAVAAVVEVQEQAVGRGRLELEGEVAPAAGVPAHVAGPLALSAGELQGVAQPQRAGQRRGQQRQEETRKATGIHVGKRYRDPRVWGEGRGGGGLNWK